MSAKKRKGERPDGLIQVSCSIGRKPDGSLNRKYFYGHSRAEAERKRDEYLKQRERNQNINPDMTVEDWVRQYLVVYHTTANPLYATSDKRPYERLISAIGELRIVDIREHHLQAALNAIAGYSYSTITKYKQTIQRVFKKAYKNKLIPFDPSDDLLIPAYKRGTHKALDRETIQLIAQHWREAGASGLWMIIMLFAGLRRGEMIALQWDCIDLTDRTLTVKRTAVIQQNKCVIEDRAKSAAGLRTIPLPAILYDALLSIPEADRSGFVCTTTKGKPLTETAVRRGTDHFCTVMSRIRSDTPIYQKGHRSDLSPLDPPTISFRLHDLRHTYCTLLFEAGVDVKTAAYLMGHSDIKVTMGIYTHLSEQQKAISTSSLLTLLDTYKPDSGQ